MPNGDLSDVAARGTAQQRPPAASADPGWGDVTQIGTDQPETGGGWLTTPPQGEGPAYQPFFNPQTQRGPSGWGQPDYVMKGAQNYPGVPPSGSGMPQARDVPGLVNQIGRGFANWGDQPSGLMGVGMMKAYGAYQKAFQEGQTKRAQLERERYVLAATQLEDRQRKIMQDYAQIRAEAKDPNSEATHQRLLAAAHSHQDQHAINALSQSGFAAFDRLLNARDETFQSLEKINLMRERHQTAELAQRREAREAAASEERLRIERERLRIEEEKAKAGTAQQQRDRETERILGGRPAPSGGTEEPDSEETPDTTTSAEPETTETPTDDSPDGAPAATQSPDQSGEPANPQAGYGQQAPGTPVAPATQPGSAEPPLTEGRDAAQLTPEEAAAAPGAPPASFQERFGGAPVAAPPAPAAPPSAEPPAPSSTPTAPAPAAPAAPPVPPAYRGLLDNTTRELGLDRAAAERFKGMGWDRLQGFTAPGTDWRTNAYANRYAADLQQALQGVANDPTLRTRNDVINALRRTYAPAASLIENMLNYDAQGYASATGQSARGLAWRNLGTDLAHKADPSWDPRRFQTLATYQREFANPNAKVQQGFFYSNRMVGTTNNVLREINGLQERGLLTGQRFTNAINQIWQNGVVGDPAFVGLQSALFEWQQDIQRVQGGGVARVAIQQELQTFAKSINSPAQLREVIKNGVSNVLATIEPAHENYQDMFAGHHYNTPGYRPATVAALRAIGAMDVNSGRINLPPGEIPPTMSGVSRGAFPNPPAPAIQRLREHPEWRKSFDEIFGQGAADRALNPDAR